MPGNCWDSLDPLHASDSAGSHADWPEMSPGTGYIHKFHSTARALRVRFAYGKGQTIARSVAKRFGLEWHRPMALTLNRLVSSFTKAAESHLTIWQIFGLVLEQLLFRFRTAFNLADNRL